MSPPLSQALAAAVLQLLRPLVRLLLRHGVGYDALAELAKRVYVETGQQEFGIEGRKQTISRISILTGLTRKEVQRVLSLPGLPVTGATERYNRAARVIAGWVRDPDFADGQDGPAALPLQDHQASFAEVVKRYSGDVPARAMLDELLRVAAVERLDDGRIRLRTRAYIPQAGDADKIAILGTDVSDLIATIDHNLQQGAAVPRFQRKVMYDNLPLDTLPELRALSATRGQTLLEGLDRWLAPRDRDVNPEVQGTGRARAGIGIYYFEETLPSGQEEN